MPPAEGQRNTPSAMTAGCWNSITAAAAFRTKALVHDVMTNEKMWGQDLTLVPGFEQAAAGKPAPHPYRRRPRGFRRVPARPAV